MNSGKATGQGRQTNKKEDSTNEEQQCHWPSREDPAGPMQHHHQSIEGVLGHLRALGEITHHRGMSNI